ncbi:MAG: tetratricopeptide repeat protein [Aphanothece sp. CMT-3BRIN-NPC111]|jgi:tetratricopeptide (TPR) repeat protein|nr:tetratricopeptide repeat protein [Aphanothece sp. CMT-3BRIN-NPC111]
MKLNESSQDNTEAAAIKVKLATAWQLKGKFERAIAACQQALHLQQNYFPAWVKFGDLMLQQGRLEEALHYYEQALALNPEDLEVSSRYQQIKNFLETAAAQKAPQNQESKPQPVLLKDNPEEKINLYNQKTFNFHRSGWQFALNALKPLHNSKGILFDGFLENNFAWRHSFSGKRESHILEMMKRSGRFEQFANSEEQGITPYSQPWIGIFHNPPNMPKWFHYEQSPQTILAKDIWKQSLENCLGLFTLSEYHAKWLREQTGKLVSTLIHPTEIPEIQFDFKKFLDNPHKKIVQVGWWLRRINAIYQLPIEKSNYLNYEKVRLVTQIFTKASEHFNQLIERERELDDLITSAPFYENTIEKKYLPNNEYDQFLSQNIVFLNLYDASANNAVVECIARATPLLINPLPAVVEYLGEDYPFYYSNLSEAAAKALDTSLIWDTHNYLKNWEVRQKLSAEYFLQSFKKSEVYQLI